MGGFRAKPDDLKKVANGDLDAIIFDYIEPAKKILLDTTQDDGEAFSGGSKLGEVETTWNESRGLLKRVLEDNMENLELARKALVEIADRYIAADDDAASELRSAGGMYS